MLILIAESEGESESERAKKAEVMHILAALPCVAFNTGGKK